MFLGIEAEPATKQRLERLQERVYLKRILSDIDVRSNAGIRFNRRALDKLHFTRDLLEREPAGTIEGMNTSP